MDNKKTDAYALGYQNRLGNARERGQCPYEPSTPEHSDWKAGFQAADDDDAW